MAERRKILLIVNPRAGKAAIRARMLGILDCFSKNGFDTTVYVTQAPGEATRVAAECGGQFDVVACSGGDGTLDETLNGLMRLEHPPLLGYVPAGTTNDFANSFGLPKDMVEAAEVICEGVPTEFDVGQFNERYFSYVAAFGAFTDVTYGTSQDIKHALGKLAYVLEGMRRLPEIRPYHISVRHDGGVIEDDILVGIVSNSRYVAGLPIGVHNDVSMSDGLMEVILIRNPDNILDLTPLINTLFSGKIESDLVYSFKTSALELESVSSIPWTLDGEYGGRPNQVRIVNQPRRLTLLTPGTENA